MNALLPTALAIAYTVIIIYNIKIASGTADQRFKLVVQYRVANNPAICYLVCNM